VTVVLSNEPGNAAQRLRAAGSEVVTIPLRRARATFRPRPHLELISHLASEVRSIRKVIRERAIDVVQICGLVNPHGAIAGRLEGTAVVWQLLDTRAPMVVRRLMMPLVLRLSDVVMSTGLAVARVHPGAERLRERLLIFFPPVEPEVFRLETMDRDRSRARFGFRSNDVVLGTVGNLNPQKGHEFLLEAAALARASNIAAKVLVVGFSHETHRAYEQQLYSRCQRLGLVVGRDAVFAGGLEDVRPALAAMDIFVLSSVPLSEGAPTAMEEAMMMSRPVVAADVGAVSELIEDGVTGFLVPPLDPRALSQAILRVVGTPSIQSTVGPEARRRAIALCSVEECASIHLEAYERALSRRETSSESSEVAGAARAGRERTP
jgi:glycosyltransferase involved in cell wall biosynthesis